ncbi:MAG: hypothetical protein HZB68_00180 [Candidatus Aenigmarchaeota archaeon]|nr:hypothetical protein [Candidatus Aenigmarchaeota archaeon]
MGNLDNLYKHWLESENGKGTTYEETTIDALLEKDVKFAGFVRFSGRINEIKNFQTDNNIFYFTLESEKTGGKIIARGFFRDSDYLMYQAPFSVSGDKVTIEGRYQRNINGLRIDSFYNHDLMERLEGG